MGNIKKYSAIYWIYFKTSLARDLAFRFSFFASIIGSLCFICLSFFVIYFLTQKVTIGNWTPGKMLVLLGNFYILEYAFFYFFSRGLTKLIENVRNGELDFYLLKPVDTQFYISFIGGGTQNLLSLIFGIGVVIYSLVNLNLDVSPFQIILSVFLMIISILAFYSFALIMTTLNFKHGYFEEAIRVIFAFHDSARYPMDAFVKLPLHLLIIAVPFSALSTIPTKVLVNTDFPIEEVGIFLFLTTVFIVMGRVIWQRALRQYTSAS